MDVLGSALIGGLLLGLAGSLHCAAMCGGVAAGNAYWISRRKKSKVFLAFLSITSGRIGVYSLLGTLLASSAELATKLTSLTPPIALMPWVGAILLVWIGLSTAGLFPSLSFSLTGSRLGSRRVNRFFFSFRQPTNTTPLLSGILWGLVPCPMLYAALLTSAMTGSSTQGLLWMLGFGFGTLPSILLCMFGIKVLQHTNAAPIGKLLTGLSISIFGLLTLLLDVPLFSILC